MPRAPVAVVRSPCVHTSLLLSCVVISSTTSPYVNLLCFVRFSVMLALIQTLSTHGQSFFHARASDEDGAQFLGVEAAGFEGAVLAMVFYTI